MLDTVLVDLPNGSPDRTGLICCMEYISTEGKRKDSQHIFRRKITESKRKVKLKISYSDLVCTVNSF